MNEFGCIALIILQLRDDLLKLPSDTFMPHLSFDPSFSCSEWLIGTL